MTSSASRIPCPGSRASNSEPNAGAGFAVIAVLLSGCGQEAGAAGTESGGRSRTDSAGSSGQGMRRDGQLVKEPFPERLHRDYTWKSDPGVPEVLSDIRPQLPTGTEWQTSDGFAAATTQGHYAATFCADFARRVVVFDARNPRKKTSLERLALLASVAHPGRARCFRFVFDQVRAYQGRVVSVEASRVRPETGVSEVPTGSRAGQVATSPGAPTGGRSPSERIAAGTGAAGRKQDRHLPERSARVAGVVRGDAALVGVQQHLGALRCRPRGDHRAGLFSPLPDRRGIQSVYSSHG